MLQSSGDLQISLVGKLNVGPKHVVNDLEKIRIKC